MRRGPVLFWVGLAGVLLVVGILAGRRGGEGPPLDPGSTGPLGTHGLVAFLAELGADVSRDLPDDGTATALLLADRLGDDQRDALGDWVDGGGTLVVTDSTSEFSPASGPSSIAGEEQIPAGTCSLTALAEVTLEAGNVLLYPSERADERCFGDDEQSFLHATARGEGLVVALGGAIVFTNEQLDEADNAVLAAELLLGPAGGEGATVAVVFDPIAEPGTRTLADLVPSGAKWAAWQLAAAFVIYALWRSRRFGRPVTEPQPVVLPGSLLVRAAAELQRRAGGHGAAATAIRGDLERRLRKRVKAPPDLSAAEVAELAASQAPVEPGTVQRVMLGSMASSGADLGALVADVDALDEALDPEPGGGTL